MSYMESYESMDWPFLGGQFQAGLSVQLPGSENLLPAQNGYLVEAAADLLLETKHQSKGDNFLDITEEDDWNFSGLDVAVLHTSGDFSDGDIVFDADDLLLPASPEIASYDLNVATEHQYLSQTALCRRPSVGYTQLPEISTGRIAIPTSVPEIIVRACDHQTKTVPEDIFDDGRLCDFDPDWLLSSVPILPSLEEVESVLSASPPLDILSDEVPLSPTEIEPLSSESNFSPISMHFGGAQLENLQLSGSSVKILLPNNAYCSVQVPQNMAWIGESAAGVSLDLYSRLLGINNTSAIVTGSDSLSSFESSCVSSDIEEIGYGPSDPLRSSPVSLRVEPYPISKVKPERRERKREQNKTAALKYRQKKRSEQGVFVSECDQLEKRNSELKSRAEELTREISYLKGLISEIYYSQAE